MISFYLIHLLVLDKKQEDDESFARVVLKQAYILSLGNDKNVKDDDSGSLVLPYSTTYCEYNLRNVFSISHCVIGITC